MDKIELSKHKKQGDTLYTPFTSPSGLGAKLSLSSWEGVGCLNFFGLV